MHQNELVFHIIKSIPDAKVSVFELCGKQDGKVNSRYE